MTRRLLLPLVVLLASLSCGNGAPAPATDPAKTETYRYAVLGNFSFNIKYTEVVKTTDCKSI